MAHLLNPEFLRWLAALRRRLQLSIRAGGVGLWSAKGTGTGAQFHEHRPYHPGDDPRRIDWSVFARTGEAMLKTFESEEETALYLILDTSASLEFGEPSKFDVARRLAAAVGYLTLTSSGRAQVIFTPNPIVGPRAELALFATTPVLRGSTGFLQLAQNLERLSTCAEADLAKAIEHTLKLTRRPSVLCVVSDFLVSATEPLLLALEHAAKARHEIALFQILTAFDLDPDLDGDLTLEDAETGERMELTADPASLRTYHEQFAGLCEQLQTWALRRRARYFRAITDEPLEHTIELFIHASSRKD